MEQLKSSRLEGSRFKTANVVVKLFEHGTVKRIKVQRLKKANVMVELFKFKTLFQWYFVPFKSDFCKYSINL